MVFLEYVGALSGLAGIWLTMRQRIWCFPVGLFSVAISCFVFFDSKLYADALQQLVFAILLIVGWVRWSKKLEFDTVSVSKLDRIQRMSWLLITMVIGLVLGYILDRYTDAHYPWMDSMLSAFCFLAQYLIALRKIENWWLWILTNVGYIFVYAQKELEPYAFLYSVYLILAFVGLREWNKQLKSHA
jgi:nicotinamide mononucleotide transporter